MGVTHLESLIQRAKSGDRAALDELFAAVRPWLREELGYLFRSCGQPFADGSDVAQETCLRAMGAFPEFPGSQMSDLYRWLRAIARNCSADLRRFEQAAVRNVRQRVSGSAVLTKLVATTGSVADRSMRDEEAAAVMAALQHLTHREQEVLRLRFFEQRSFDDIAAESQEKPVTVRQRCLRALAKLQVLLKE